MKRKKKHIIEDKNVEFVEMPIPKICYDKKRRFPFDKLQVGGNCMIVNGMTPKRLKSYAWQASKKLKHRYIMRKLGENKVGVWRVE